MKRILVVCGTRPEGVKVAPVVKALQQTSMSVRLCVTGQHRQLLDPILRFFSLSADYDLALMRQGQTLHEVTAGVVTGLKPILDDYRPHCLLVQGDTTSALAGALAAFYEKIPVGHIEAGLRTGDMLSPFPEEMNRVLVSRLAALHFAPTEQARALLNREGVAQGVHVTGNTVTDALLTAKSLVERSHWAEFSAEFKQVLDAPRVIVVTGHRRESFGAPFESMCHAIRRLAQRFLDVSIVYPVHLNPCVREPVERILGGVSRVHLIEPVDYPRMVYLLMRATVVLTDSGGIQEEAPSLGKPVLVMREVTERPEGIAAGCARLVGTETTRIVDGVSTLLTDATAYAAMAQVQNPYGDGQAAPRIVGHLERFLASRA